jgi:hypothetical protein
MQSGKRSPKLHLAQEIQVGPLTQSGLELYRWLQQSGQSAAAFARAPGHGREPAAFKSQAVDEIIVFAQRLAAKNVEAIVPEVVAQ